MLTIPFLTDLDSRAAVRGSRDPLGIQTIWTRFGRHVVGNLTTVTTSVRDFTVLLLGYHFAERLAEAGSGVSTLHAFLKWEQLASYARAAVNKDFVFRGTERVSKRLSEGGKVELSIDPTWTTLGDQKNYGLWGLYTVPARASGLIDGDPPRLSRAAREFVEGFYLPALGQGAGRRGERILTLLAANAPRIDPAGKDRALVEAVAGPLKLTLRKDERAFYWSHLLLGGPDDETKGLQGQLVDLLSSNLRDADFTWSPAVVAGLASAARRKGNEWTDLARRLDRIRACESVAAPASVLFSYLQGCDARPLEEVAANIAKAWKGGCPVDVEAVAEVGDEMGAALAGSSGRWQAIANALAGGAYANLIDLVIQQNAEVMRDRGGSPWIEKRGAKLDVRFRDEATDLPKHGDLKSLWRFPYFLDSLRIIGASLREKA